MLIGQTYDLREDYLAMGYGEIETAEFDRPDTIAAIERAIQSLGHETDRIGHGRALVERLARGERWDLVFNIAEGLQGVGREAQIPAILDLYGIPYTFSDPMVLGLTLHKGMTKHVLRSLDLPTPDFVVVQEPADAEGVRLPFPLFAKPVAEGTGKGVSAMSRARDKAGLLRVCRRLLDEFCQPVLVEAYLPGREFTVGILGTGRAARSLGTLEVVLRDSAEAGVYSYTNKEECEERVEYRLVDDAEAGRAAELALAAWRGLGCRDGGRVDLRSDSRGQPQLLEINPLAGLHPEHSDLPILCAKTGHHYQDLIREILESAGRRASAPAKAGAP